MFMRFNVGNFLSFNEVQEFSLIGGKMKSKMNHLYINDKIKLLKFAALYGANASGKSNLVSAIDFARETVVHKFPNAHTVKYNKNYDENKKKKSYFEFEIKLGEKYYTYGFECLLSESLITSEWLVELLSNGQSKNVFIRDVKKGSFDVSEYFKSRKIINKLQLYAEDIKNDGTILLLRLMNQNKDNFYLENNEAMVLRDVFKWIKTKLDVNYPDRPISNYSYFMTDENIDEISRILSAFGTGITKFNIVDMSIEAISGLLPKELIQRIISDLEQAKNENKRLQNGSKTKMMVRSNKKDFIIFEITEESEIKIKTLKFNHGKNEILFSLSEESDGTVRLLDLLEILLDTKKEKVYVIDEIDRCLHPQLTYKFVETFLRLASDRNVQLIVTTHESRLLDFDLLRRDEIWFAEKDSEGSTTLYSLEEYNSRFDCKVDKAYLDGRYGGVPLFSTIFPVKEY